MGASRKKTSTASGPPRPRSGSRVLASCRPSSSFSLPSLLTESEQGQLCLSALLSLLSPLSVRFAPSSVPLSLSSFSPPVGPPLSLVLLPLPPLHFTCFLFRSVLSTLGGARLDCFWAPHTYTLLSLSCSTPERGRDGGRREGDRALRRRLLFAPRLCRRRPRGPDRLCLCCRRRHHSNERKHGEEQTGRYE